MNKIILVKLGGSLFEFPMLAKAWVQWRQSFPPEKLVWVILGGGKAADWIRGLQKIHHFSEALAHDMAIDSMRLIEPYFMELFALSQNGDKWPTKMAPVKNWLADLNPNHENLPRDWTVTSDAITLRLSDRPIVERVIFLKSVGPKRDTSLDLALEKGWVDDWTIHHGRKQLADQGIPFEWINLRLWSPEDSGV